MTVTDFGPLWDATLQNSIKSSSGTVFMGAVNGSRAEVSQLVGEEQFISTTYETAPTVTDHRIFGLEPGMQFDVTVTPLGPQQQITITPGTSFTTDANGVIEFQVVNGNVVAQ